MKHLLIIMFLLGFNNLVYSQKIVRAEYFIDSDLGIGKNTPITIASNDQNPNVTLNLTADLSTILPGVHSLFVRVKDENKRWSIAAQQPFQVIMANANSNIIKAEYFIDHLAEGGSGTNIEISTQSSTITLIPVLDLSQVSTGMHILYIRVKDNNNRWSIMSSNRFYLVSSREIAKVKSFEYYFKGAAGNSSTYTFSNFIPGFYVELKDADFLANVSELEYDKQYTLYIRALNDNGKYSSYSTLQFTLKKLSTGIQNLQSSGMTMYPNPATDFIYLKSGGSEDPNNLEYFIYNQQGKTIDAGKVEAGKIDIQTLATGNYILVVKTGSTIYKGEIFLKK